MISTLPALRSPKTASSRAGRASTASTTKRKRAASGTTRSAKPSSSGSSSFPFTNSTKSQLLQKHVAFFPPLRPGMAPLTHEEERLVRQWTTTSGEELNVQREILEKHPEFSFNYFMLSLTREEVEKHRRLVSREETSSAAAPAEGDPEEAEEGSRRKIGGKSAKTGRAAARARATAAVAAAAAAMATTTATSDLAMEEEEASRAEPAPEARPSQEEEEEGSRPSKREKLMEPAAISRAASSEDSSAVSGKERDEDASSELGPPGSPTGASRLGLSEAEYKSFILEATLSSKTMGVQQLVDRIMRDLPASQQTALSKRRLRRDIVSFAKKEKRDRDRAARWYPRPEGSAWGDSEEEMGEEEETPPASATRPTSGGSAVESSTQSAAPYRRANLSETDNDEDEEEEEPEERRSEPRVGPTATVPTPKEEEAPALEVKPETVSEKEEEKRVPEATSEIREETKVVEEAKSEETPKAAEA